MLLYSSLKLFGGINMIFETVAAIIADKMGIEPQSISMNSNFEDLQVDSLAMVEIMLAIEDEFNITIDDAEGIETVYDVVSYVENKTEGE